MALFIYISYLHCWRPFILFRAKESLLACSLVPDLSVTSNPHCPHPSSCCRQPSHSPPLCRPCSCTCAVFLTSLYFNPIRARSVKLRVYTGRFFSLTSQRRSDQAIIPSLQHGTIATTRCGYLLSLAALMSIAAFY